MKPPPGHHAIIIIMSSSSSWPPGLNMYFIVFSYVPSFPCTPSTPPNRKETRAEVPAPNHLVNAPSPPPSCIDHLAMHCWLVQWQCGIKQLHLYIYIYRLNKTCIQYLCQYKYPTFKYCVFILPVNVQPVQSLVTIDSCRMPISYRLKYRTRHEPLNWKDDGLKPSRAATDRSVSVLLTLVKSVSSAAN